MAATAKFDRRGHICPPSDAAHPSDRWESLFVYAFVCKFTNLKSKVQGMDSPMDFENALLSKEPNDILTQLLGHFVLNLKPQTRNLSTDQISSTVANVLSEYFKSSERTIFWNEELKANVDPFESIQTGFFAADWDFKLKILRQLVELQLCHSVEIKGNIDRAWGVVHNKHKKKDNATAPLEPTDPGSQEILQFIPLGQDSQRKRYWVVDDSPRIYVSTNPWKTTATFKAISSTREEYMAIIESIKSTAPPEPKKGKKLSKLENAHLALIAALESRVVAIDAELARVQRVRRRIEQKQALFAQAELRETRTRKKTQKPDYVYHNDFDSEDDGDEYKFQEEEHHDEEFDGDFTNIKYYSLHGGRRQKDGSSAGQRRSTRAAALNMNGKREGSSDSWGQGRGGRRSSRIVASSEEQLDSEPPLKRARTEESTTSTNSGDMGAVSSSNGLKIKISGAAALKPTEIALEQIAGKKRSKFWVYAVEPIPGAAPVPSEPIPGGTNNGSIFNGYQGIDNGHATITRGPCENGNGKVYERSLEGSLSPLHSS